MRKALTGRRSLHSASITRDWPGAAAPRSSRGRKDSVRFPRCLNPTENCSARLCLRTAVRRVFLLLILNLEASVDLGSISLSVAETASQKNCPLFLVWKPEAHGPSLPCSYVIHVARPLTKGQEQTWDLLPRAGPGWGGLLHPPSRCFVELEPTRAGTQL